jgi:hypothetical protein
MADIVLISAVVMVAAAEQSEGRHAEEVEANETTTGSKDPCNFGQHPFPPKDVVQHRTGQDQREPTVVEGELGGIGLLNRGSLRPGTKRPPGSSHHLVVVVGGNDCHVIESAQQAGSHRATTGSDLQEQGGTHRDGVAHFHSVGAEH